MKRSYNTIVVMLMCLMFASCSLLPTQRPEIHDVADAIAVTSTDIKSTAQIVQSLCGNVVEDGDCLAGAFRSPGAPVGRCPRSRRQVLRQRTRTGDPQRRTDVFDIQTFVGVQFFRQHNPGFLNSNFGTPSISTTGSCGRQSGLRALLDQPAFKLRQG